MPTVLIVDDTDSDRKLASKVVSKAGHSIITANSGTEAVTMLGRHKPDLILLDVVMPGMDGFKTCRKIRELGGFENTPIVLVTSKDTPSDLFRGKKQGATDHLGKPYKPKALEAIISKYLR
jgi:CheY-like chemotaxis protein